MALHNYRLHTRNNYKEKSTKIHSINIIHYMIVRNAKGFSKPHLNVIIKLYRHTLSFLIEEKIKLRSCLFDI